MNLPFFAPAAELTSKSVVVDPIISKKLKAAHILIVEDESDISLPLKVRLGRLGYKVTTASEGLDGLAKALTLLPDLILLDLVLPKMSGESICKAIKESDVEAVRSIPIVMMSGKDKESDQIVGRVIGASAYLTKPFEFKELLGVIGRYLSSVQRLTTRGKHGATD